MKDSVEGFPPEGQKPLQFGKFRTEVVFLPDIGLEQPGMIGTPVKDVRSRQAVALHLTAEVTALHLALQLAETQTLRHMTVPLQAQKVNNLFIIKALAAINQTADNLLAVHGNEC
jgi:hypothetical protein